MNDEKVDIIYIYSRYQNPHVNLRPTLLFCLHLQTPVSFCFFPGYLYPKLCTGKTKKLWRKMAELHATTTHKPVQWFSDSHRTNGNSNALSAIRLVCEGGWYIVIGRQQTTASKYRDFAGQAHSVLLNIFLGPGVHYNGHFLWCFEPWCPIYWT